MSMMLCDMCANLWDTDEFPDGFYTVGHPDKYICDGCRETHDLKTEFEESLDKALPGSVS